MSTGCPNVIVLTRFASGVLDERVAHEVSHHLDRCEKCQTRTDDLVRETDSLVLAIRAGNSEAEDLPILGDIPLELDLEKPPATKLPSVRPLDVKSPETHPKEADSTLTEDDGLEWQSERDESQLNRLISGVRNLAPNPKSSMLPEPTRRPLRKADLDQFVSALRRSTLLEEEHVEELLGASHAETTEAFAQELIDQGVLTPYQARVLIRGRWKGLVLGNYEILEKLGQGGMGQVYRAKHRRMGRMVCLKVLRSSGRRSADTVERFRREIKTISSLDHPHFVIAHDADEADGIQFLVMEFIEGRDLARLVFEDGPMRWKDALRVILQVADALDYAHSEGVIHRDIKPHNLILTPDEEGGGVGHTKVLDLGIARIDSVLGAGDSRTQATMTSTGTIVGTVDYMSPEQALNSRHADSRSDIYSLGCTLYFLATGKTLHPGETIMERLVAHRENVPPQIRDHVPRAEKAGEAVFQKMVAREPEDRYQTMGEVIDDLKALLRGRRPMAQSLSLPVWARDMLRQHSNPAVAISAIVCALALVAAFVWLPDTFGGSETDSTGRSGFVGESEDVSSQKALSPLMVVVPSGGVNENELFAAQHWLTKKGVPFELASSRTGTLKSSSDRNIADVNRTIFDYSPQNYSGVMFVGGSVGEFKDKGKCSSHVHSMIKATLNSQGTVIGISNGKFVLDGQGFCVEESSVEDGLLIGSIKRFQGASLIHVTDQNAMPQLASWLEARRSGG